MAPFETALEAMRAGKKVRRASWPSADGIEFQLFTVQKVFSTDDIIATDWEVLPDPEPEPIWMLLEPGMTIREGDRVFYQGLWDVSRRVGHLINSDDNPYRRRIEVAK